MSDLILDQCLQIVSRQTALSAGLRSYFTGLPCGNGHFSLRSTKRRACAACEQAYRDDRKELIADYKHRYHIENKEKLCQTSRDWYASNKKRAAEYNRAHYLSNKEKYAEWRKAWIAANPDRNREWNKEWRQANSERLIAASREWKRNNMVKVLTYNRNRRSISKGAEGFHSAEDILKIYRAQRGRCAHCRKDVRSGYHVDHITPLVSGGSNWPENLQILCPLCNLSKSSKDPIEWKQQHGMLL